MSRKDRQNNAEQKVAQYVGTISSSDNILRKAKDLWRASPQDHTVIMRAFIKVCRGRSMTMTEAEIADLVRQLDPEPVRSAPAPRLGLAVDMATTFGTDGGERVKGRGARRTRDS